MKNSWPKFTKKESELVQKILLSNKVNYLFGSEGKKFEKNFSRFSNTKYALAVANGTLALEIGRGQNYSVSNILRLNGFRVTKKIKDYRANVRCIFSTLK